MAAASIAATAVLAWAVSYLAGGSHTVWPHLFYVPILLAASRFGHPGAFVAAAIAGVLAGALLPLDVDAGTSQQAANWSARLGMFMVIGQAFAATHSRSLPIVTRRLRAHWSRRLVRDALEQGQIRPVFQPIVSLPTGRIVGMEALARWYHPTRGTLGPAELFPMAEAAGLVREVDATIMRQACEHVARWRQGPLASWDEFKLGVNIAGQEFDAEGLTGEVVRVLEDTGVPPSWLFLEITETVLAEDVDRVARGLVGVKLLGVRLAIDDFGVGQSSLAALHRFPVDVIKIDKTFVDMLGGEERSESLISGLIRLALTLDVWAVVIEGVERDEQCRQLASLGRLFAQGYLFSPPVPPEEAIGMIELGVLGGSSTGSLEGASVR